FKLNHKQALAAAVISLSAFVITPPAIAENFGLSLKASTLGAGIELSAGLAENLNVRVGANYFKFAKTLEEDGTNYDFDLKLNSFTALVDWHVFSGGFRITGGGVLDKNSLEGVAQVSDFYDIGNQTFSQAEVGTLNGLINFRNISPYVGIGWGNMVSGDSNWVFTADLGVIFTGTPRVDLNSVGGTLSNNAVFLAEIAREEQNVANDLDFFKFYPVVSIGMSYRF
ncbi:hypothetical protein MNBD_ALPHA03-975, partial [hydrothermal vent metagenome]